MASTVGRIEKKTQQRIVTLLCEQLRYDYPGDWTDCENIRNVEPDLLSLLLKKQGHDDSLISSTPHQSHKAATDQSKKLYDRKKGSMTCCALRRKGKSGYWGEHCYGLVDRPGKPSGFAWGT